MATFNLIGLACDPVVISDHGRPNDQDTSKLYTHELMYTSPTNQYKNIFLLILSLFIIAHGVFSLIYAMYIYAQLDLLLHCSPWFKSL